MVSARKTEMEIFCMEKELALTRAWRDGDVFSLRNDDKTMTGQRMRCETRRYGVMRCDAMMRAMRRCDNMPCASHQSADIAHS